MELYRKFVKNELEKIAEIAREEQKRGTFGKMCDVIHAQGWIDISGFRVFTKTNSELLHKEDYGFVLKPRWKMVLLPCYADLGTDKQNEGYINIILNEPNKIYIDTEEYSMSKSAYVNTRIAESNGKIGNNRISFDKTIMITVMRPSKGGYDFLNTDSLRINADAIEDIEIAGHILKTDE